MSDVMQNQGLLRAAPPSQPCCCSPRTASTRPVRLPSPSRIWGAIGKTTDGTDVMSPSDPPRPLFSHTSPAAVPVLKGPEHIYGHLPRGPQTLRQTVTWRIEIAFAIAARFGPCNPVALASSASLCPLRSHTGPFRIPISI